MTKSRDAIRRSFARLAEFWAERTARSSGENYEVARAELGDAPWREVPKSTDAWFIIDNESLPDRFDFQPGRLRRWRGPLLIALCLAGPVAAALVIAKLRAPHVPASPPLLSVVTPSALTANAPAQASTNARPNSLSTPTDAPRERRKTRSTVASTKKQVRARAPHSPTTPLGSNDQPVRR
jgi:hypothetical protein